MVPPDASEEPVERFGHLDRGVSVLRARHFGLIAHVDAAEARKPRTLNLAVHRPSSCFSLPAAGLLFLRQGFDSPPPVLGVA